MGMTAKTEGAQHACRAACCAACWLGSSPTSVSGLLAQAQQQKLRIEPLTAKAASISLRLALLLQRCTHCNDTRGGGGDSKARQLLVV